jgi:hypothetical protein
LPVTGDIDSATLQALQSSTEKGSPAIQAIPVVSPTTPAPQPSNAIIAKDRAFLAGLKEVEISPAAPAPAFRTAREEAPALEPAANPISAVTNIAPAAPVEAPIPPQREVAISPPPPKPAPANPEPENPTSRGGEESPTVEPHTSGKTPRERIVSAPEQRPSKPVAVASRPQRRVEPAPVPARIEASESDRDALEPQRVRIIRHPTRIEQPEERITITERRTTTSVGREVEPVEIRRATPVGPPKKEGFFQRLFKDDEDERDKDDD